MSVECRKSSWERLRFVGMPSKLIGQRRVGMMAMCYEMLLKKKKMNFDRKFIEGAVVTSFIDSKTVGKPLEQRPLFIFC